ncbi:SAICAR synthase-like protein [Polyplosphaeria fusca]|uniref:SAICAR synthase-like protein n=1 Tax=Polyplosphaeria fusca TaxID=682080 RepID=A0A9P4V988_9PLEO|nr:SAICAR synthase-like protein [Polyplosphaeria fusca]
MELNENSLLVRITDLLYAPSPSIGTALGTAPSHHMVMENLLYGKSDCSTDDQKKWETYDLKPNTYFYPERDVMGGKLAPESVKERLIDEFPDKIRVTIEEKEELVSQLTRDTKILQDANAVDYSLFVVRYPASLSSVEGGKVPVPPGRPSSWRNGTVSRDEKWIYRAILLDFFWAKDSLQAQAMSITTTTDEYRQRFLKMVDDIVEVVDSAGRPAGEVRNTAGEASDDS